MFFLLQWQCSNIPQSCVSVSVCQSPRKGMTAFDPPWRCSSYNQLTNTEIITEKHKAYLLRVSASPCASGWVTKRLRKKWEIGRWGHGASEHPLKSRENENCSKHSKNPPRASLTVLFFRAGSDSDPVIFSAPQPNRIPDFRRSRLMITDIERALLSDPGNPEP